jgi:molybdopterin synthase sulfur carrier subunit
MKIRFFAYIRDYTDSKEIDFGYCETVQELLLKLCSKYGKRFEQKIFKGTELSSEIIILVNGRHIIHYEGLQTQLSENDEISIFPVVAGG